MQMVIALNMAWHTVINLLKIFLCVCVTWLPGSQRWCHMVMSEAGHPEQGSGRCVEATAKMLHDFHKWSDHGGLVSVGPPRSPPVDAEQWLVVLDAVSGTLSTQRLTCSHYEHPTEEETEAWKAESVLASWLRRRKRQPMLASLLQERDASSLQEARRRQCYLAGYPGKLET